MDDVRSAPPMTRARAIVKSVVREADQPLSAAEIRQRALERDPHLAPLTVAIATADLRLAGKIEVRR
jgi:Fe2+ or Zn2+ uptake regulation protein